jgi:hypothetical protein
MKIDKKIVDRLEQLIEMGAQVSRTATSRSTRTVEFWGDHAVDNEMSHQWGTSCLNLLGRVFGKESDHYVRFASLFPEFDNYSPVVKALGILKAAKDDYENGYLFEARTLIQAEVFDDFLEQAEYLFNSGYHEPAAVVAGAVQEDGLRQLCIKNKITLPAKPKLDTMNADLAKAGVFSVLAQKQITTSADIRNKAAHGQWAEFTKDDVKQMLAHVRSFMESHFS